VERLERRVSQDWQDFFTTLAQVAVTAFSVMFLAMQVRASVWRGSRLLGVAAYSSLIELFVPLLAALVTLMGGHPWRIAAWLAGGLGLAMVVLHWLIYWYRPALAPDITAKERRFHLVQLRGSLISIVVYGLIVLSAADPLGWGIHLLAAMCVWLLFSGCFEAWWLLEPQFARAEPRSAVPEATHERQVDVVDEFDDRRLRDGGAAEHGLVADQVERDPGGPQGQLDGR
jgi:hypothetical protein